MNLAYNILVNKLKRILPWSIGWLMKTFQNCRPGKYSILFLCRPSNLVYLLPIASLWRWFLPTWLSNVINEHRCMLHTARIQLWTSWVDNIVRLFLLSMICANCMLLKCSTQSFGSSIIEFSRCSKFDSEQLLLCKSFWLRSLKMRFKWYFIAKCCKYVNVAKHFFVHDSFYYIVYFFNDFS